MTYKKKIAVGILATLAISSLGAVSAFAADTDEEMRVDLTAVHAALDASDYDAFVEALSVIDARAAAQMTEETFATILARYEHKEAVQDIIETGSYDEWVSAMSEVRGGAALVEVTSEDEWETFQALHDARAAGDIDTAKELATEIGLDVLHEERKEVRKERRGEFREEREERQEKRGERSDARQGERQDQRPGERGEQREAIRGALENADYEAWQVAIAGTHAEEVLGPIISEDNFADLVEVHDLRVSGDHEAARAAADDFGLPEMNREEARGEEGESRRGFFHRVQGMFRGIFAQ